MKKINIILLSSLITTTTLFAGGSVEVTPPDDENCEEHDHDFFCDRQKISFAARHIRVLGQYTITGNREWSAGKGCRIIENGSSAILYTKCMVGDIKTGDVTMSFDWVNGEEGGNTTSSPGSSSITVLECEGVESDFNRSPEANIISGTANQGYKTEGLVDIIYDKNGNFDKLKGSFKGKYMGVYEGMVDSKVKDGKCYKTKNDNDCCVIDKFYGFNDGTGGVVEPDTIKINGIDPKIEDLLPLLKALEKLKKEYEKIKSEKGIKEDEIKSLNSEINAKQKTYNDLLDEEMNNNKKLQKKLKEYKLILDKALERYEARIEHLNSLIKPRRWKQKEWDKRMKEELKKARDKKNNAQEKYDEKVKKAKENFEKKNKKLKKAREELIQFIEKTEKKIKKLGKEVEELEQKMEEIAEKATKLREEYEKACEKAMKNAADIAERWAKELRETIEHESGHRKIAWFFADKLTDALKKFRARGYSKVASKANELAKKEFESKKDKIINDIIDESEDFQEEYDSPTGSDHGEKQGDWDWKKLDTHKGLGGIL